MPFDASPVDSEVVTVLKKARALIDRPEKWCKEALLNDLGQRCIYGALDREGTDNPAPRETTDDAAHFIRQVIGFDSIVTWNNCVGRTHSEVMEAFDKAIILAGGTP